MKKFRSTRRLRGTVALVLLVVGMPSCSHPPQFDDARRLIPRTMVLKQGRYPYVAYLPSQYDGHRAFPLLVLVHGAGGNGLEFIRHWIPIAESKGVILLAPTLDLSAAAEPDVPIVFPKLVDDAATHWNIDRTRRYLFGYSGGGYFVFDAALLRADYFAAGAVYASVIQPPYDSIAALAPRKTYIAIYLSDHDQYLSLDQARRTRDLLEANGMSVRLVELTNHDHEYGSIARSVNEDAWTFLSAHALR